MVQTTFTRQKRELTKAVHWMEKMRAQEVRTVTFNKEGEKVNEVREAYVDYAPEEIAEKVLDIVATVVCQHASRQRANSQNTGKFTWHGLDADLTVPQLRTLQEAHTVMNELVNKLPRRNPKLVSNTTVDGRPAFAHEIEDHFEPKSRWVPFEEDSTTRVRSYEEHYEELTRKTQVLEIDYGVDARQLEILRELVTDLGTAIQVAIDDANTKGHDADPAMDELIRGINAVLLKVLPNESEGPDS